MRRLVALVAVALAVGAGTARGDSTAPPAAGVVALPGAGLPNLDGALVLAPTWLEPPVQPVELTPEELQAVWEAAGSAYGIPWQVLAAINKIESNFGRNMGPSSAGAIGWMQFMPSTWLRWGTDADGNGVADPWNPKDAIYSSARYLRAAGGSDMPRAVFAYNHADWYVKEVLDLARLYGYDGSSSAEPAAQPTATASPVDVQPAAQAPAPTQPTTTDVPAASFGVQQPVPAPAPAPVPAAEPTSDTVVFTLDRLQADLDAAQQAVATASADYQPAEVRASELAAKEVELERLAAVAPLLSDRLEYQKEAAQASIDSQQATFEATQLRDALNQGQAELEALREQARAASFNKTAANVLAEPVEAAAPAGTTPAPATTPAATTPAAPAAQQAKWVFPVGGGPATVSVAHTHHDYPAADIAAPQGAPVYALSDARVLRSWATPDPRCGIGLTLETVDGQVWTYCHLSYLEPAVTPGANLAAGASVGLVGMTGDASGPHLHLQLQPATSYPQNQDWFQSFAGTAFRWQDAPTPIPSPAASASAPAAPVIAAPAPDTSPAQGMVFRIVQSG